MMTINEVSEWLGVPRTTVHYWVAAGEFPTARQKTIARTSAFVIPVAEVVAFLERIDRPVPPLPEGAK